MVNIIKAEHQKAKRTMRKKFIWGFPLLTFVMAFIFTLGMTNAYAESVWNWWYTLLLPGMIALFCYLSVAQEKKIKYYHLLLHPFCPPIISKGMCHSEISLLADY